MSNHLHRTTTAPYQQQQPIYSLCFSFFFFNLWSFFYSFTFNFFFFFTLCILYVISIWYTKKKKNTTWKQEEEICCIKNQFAIYLGAFALHFTHSIWQKDTFYRSQKNIYNMDLYIWLHMVKKKRKKKEATTYWRGITLKAHRNISWFFDHSHTVWIDEIWIYFGFSIGKIGKNKFYNNKWKKECNLTGKSTQKNSGFSIRKNIPLFNTFPPPFSSFSLSF